MPHDNRRSATRHDVDLPASMTVRGKNVPTSLRNLSLGGALMIYDEQLPLGERVELSFRIPTLEAPINVGAAVRWAGTGAIGVQFEGLRAREVWSLNKYFEALDD